MIQENVFGFENVLEKVRITRQSLGEHMVVSGKIYRLDK